LLDSEGCDLSASAQLADTTNEMGLYITAQSNIVKEEFFFVMG
jgi:hypothetical protein